MLGTEAIIGGVFIALAIVFLAKFAKGAVTTVFAVAIVFVGLFLIVGTPSLEDAGREVRGLIPGTGSSVYTGESLEIATLEFEDGLLLVGVYNQGTKELNEFEVFVNSESVAVEANVNKLLPGTNGVLILEYEPIAGDVITVRSGVARDEKVFGEHDNVGVTSSATVLS